MANSWTNVALGGVAIQARDYDSDAPAPPAPLGRVSRELAEQDKLLTLLHTQISTLETQLQVMLRPSSPSPDASGTGKSEAQPSETAMTVMRANDGLRSAAARLRELQARIDI
jgi:hypothetical protein